MSYSLFSVVDFGSSRTGLTTVGYRLFDSVTGFGPRITDGVAEITDGKYGALITYPEGFVGAEVWDSGEVSPVYATNVVNRESELLKKLDLPESNVVVVPPSDPGSGGRLTYGLAKTILSRVSENGICPSDSRLMQITNEAQLELLFCRDPATNMAVIPVGCMATYDVAAEGTTLFLPKELKNVIEAEVLGHNGVNGQHYIRRGGYDLVNPLTYVDPNLARDNPLVDLGLFPDPDDPSILRRKYDYPGLDENAVVRLTGAKAYVPITHDNDYLTIQNLPALKLMALAIWHRENNDREGGKAYKEDAVQMLVDEVKAFQLDPRQILKRKAEYEADLANLPRDSFGYFLARLAFELPAGLHRGKSELKRLLEQAEQQLMAKGHPVGTLEEFSADVQSGRILAPERVKTIIAADMCGQPLDIRSIFFQYLTNGPGRTCTDALIDEGEYFDSKTKKRYRQYRLGGDYMTQYYRSTQVAAGGLQGPPGEPGAPGAPGASGTQWLTGAAAPDDNLGNEGDFYLNLNTFDFYKKMGGTFVLFGNLKGPPGEAGAGGTTTPVVLDLLGLSGIGDEYLSGYNLDANNITPLRTFIVTIDGVTSFYQLQELAPESGELDVPVDAHPDWRYRRTGS